MKDLKMNILSVAVLLFALQICSQAKDIQDCKVDAVLVLDNSWSISEYGTNYQNWDFVIQFAQDIAKGLNIGPANSHIGLVDFHSYATTHFGLLEHTTETEAVQAIQELEYFGASTNTPEGLQYGRDVLTMPEYGGRDDVTKVMFIITDGEPSDEYQAGLDEEIQKTKDANIRIIAIGVTPEVKVETLQQLASSENDYFIADTFDSLTKITDAVLNENTCKPPPTRATEPPRTKPPTTVEPTTYVTGPPEPSTTTPAQTTASPSDVDSEITLLKPCDEL